MSLTALVREQITAEAARRLGTTPDKLTVQTWDYQFNPNDPSSREVVMGFASSHPTPRRIMYCIKLWRAWDGVASGWFPRPSKCAS